MGAAHNRPVAHSDKNSAASASAARPAPRPPARPDCWTRIREEAALEPDPRSSEPLVARGPRNRSGVWGEAGASQGPYGEGRPAGLEERPPAPNFVLSSGASED